jgi:DNA-binding NtrC family response regulator
LEALRRHSWPGNVRELLHAVEAAAIVCEGGEILAEHLPPSLNSTRQPATAEIAALNGRLPTLVELERMHIRQALQVSSGHRGNAARILGISERNLYTGCWAELSRPISESEVASDALSVDRRLCSTTSAAKAA